MQFAKVTSGRETAWRLSRIDEDWQAEQWGEDEEAMAMAEAKKKETDCSRCFF